jgi:hypothetical protein
MHCYLFQAATYSVHGLPTASWKTSSRFGSTTGLDVEWNLYCLELTRVGILLHNAEDFFLWDRGDNSGLITVNKIYTAIANSVWQSNISGWRKQLWIWKIPLKIKLFTWLSVENKTPTWDNLQRKGWAGPNLCQLCYKDEESINHLFTQCIFTRLVWDKIVQVNNINTAWNGISLTACFEHWFSSEHNFKLLPPIVNWFIWLTRNLKIFENKPPSINIVVYKALGLYQSWKKLHPELGKKKS